MKILNPIRFALLTAAALLWCIILITAPYALTSDSPRLISAAATVYGASGLICHQRAARSFHLAGVQLPVCGRCASLYFSGALGAVLGWTALGKSSTVRQFSSVGGGGGGLDPAKAA